MADEDGQILAGRYVLGERLGSGGSATVFLAEDRVLGRPVAVKWLRPGPENADSAARRFRREAQITASLNHPHTVQLYDAVVDGADLFLVMEYVPGPTLAQRMRAQDLAVTEVVAILRDIGRALDHAHQRGVVHRDVKPANILLDTRTGRAKLADLGIASTVHGTRMTTAGSVLGTPAYMAPELLDGRAATPAADIYSLAAVAFEALSGQPLREGDAPIAVAVQAVTTPAKDLRDVEPAAPVAAAEALSRALARDPGQRPASCRDLINAVTVAYQPEAVAYQPGKQAMEEPGEDAAERPMEEPGEQPAAEPAEEAGGVAAPAAGAAEPAEPARSWRPHLPARHPARRAAVLVAVGGTALLGVTGALLAALVPGGPHQAAPRHAAAHHGSVPRRAATGPAGTPGTSTPATPPATAPGPAQVASGPAGSPIVAVEQFYLRAARHDYPDAWALAAPSYRQQLQGYDSFRATFADVLGIQFQDIRVIASNGGTATVAVRTVSQQTDRTQRCAGTVATQAAAPSDWLISQISIQC